MAEIEKRLPDKDKKYIADHNIQFYTIDGIKIGREIGLGGRINTVLQSAFFKLANIIPADQAADYMKAAAKASYGKKGDKIVQMNYDAIDRGADGLVKIEVPASWKNATGEHKLPVAEGGRKEVVDFVNNILIPSTHQHGNELPVSAFKGAEDGTFPQGSAAYEKRGIAVSVPMWDKDKCIQCNRCALVCPHATIRPTLATAEELANKPATFETKPAIGVKGYEFRMQVSPFDCTGCSNCVAVCPAKEKALTMVPLDEAIAKEEENWDYAANLKETSAELKSVNVKNSQFKKPLFEFSGACAGCGETPYVKLMSKRRMDIIISISHTGCSSIYGGSAPTCPYTKNDKGRGPAWANSLFEDNAEFGYGMHLAYDTRRNVLANNITSLIGLDAISEDMKAALNAWLENKAPRRFHSDSLCARPLSHERLSSF